jgi:alkylated DNA repair dioxygenase AlkB
MAQASLALPRPSSIINPCSKATTAKKGTFFAPFRSFSEQRMPGRSLMAVNKPIGDNPGKAAVRKRGETIRGRAAGQGPIVNKQLSLFSTETVGPAGLRYYPEIITASMEDDLIERIRGLPLVPFQFGAYEGKRRVALFGFKYDYALRRLQEAEEVPEWLAPMIEKVEAHGGPATRIRQVLCTEYDVGVGIGWHRDKPHFDDVFGLSLGSACRFRFRRKIGEKWERVTLDAEPRSLYVMTGESRHVWQHSIPAVEAPRYSITFRSMAD